MISAISTYSVSIQNLVNEAANLMIRGKTLPGSGAHSSACNEISAVLIVRAGVHSFLRMSRQIAPVTELIFGCHIFVSNFI